MGIINETRTLQQELTALAAQPEWDFLTHYDWLNEK